MKITLHVYAIYREWNKNWQYVADDNASMHTEGWIPTGQVFELEIDDLPNTVLVQKTVEVLKAKKTKFEADAFVKAQIMQSCIDDLLSLEHKPEVEDL